MEEKKEIRKKILIVRDSMSNLERTEKSDKIIEKLMTLDSFKYANNILAYLSYNSEVNTDQFINACLSLGKQVFVPKVIGENMFFIRMLSFDDLTAGYKGIREPDISEDMIRRITDWQDIVNDETVDLENKLYFSHMGNENDFMIMPGAVFDRDRNRIGYGKGFYDRYLSQGFKGHKVALAFNNQIVKVDSFSTEATDIKPDSIITECEIIGIEVS